MLNDSSMAQIQIRDEVIRLKDAEVHLKELLNDAETRLTVLHE